MSDKNWIVKAFHTGGPYQKDADKLRASAVEFDIPIDIEVIESQGNWNLNTHYKPMSILEAMNKHGVSKNIWHVDIDTWFLQYPSMFDEDNDWDIAAFYFSSRKTWCSGTVFCRNTYPVRELLYDWRTELVSDEKQHGDQVALGELLDQASQVKYLRPLKIGKIPAGYLQGLSKNLKEGEGVIAHDGARKRYVGTAIYTEPKG